MLKKCITFIFVVNVLITSVVWGQDDNALDTTKNDLMMVLGAGAGGAVLGLSTLSFYDKPSKHVSNVWMGAALGIIAGVAYVAVDHAQKSQTQFQTAVPATPDLGTMERINLQYRGQYYQQNEISSLGHWQTNLWTQSF